MITCPILSVYRNCDARFSCESFREYVRQTSAKNQAFLKYLEDTGDDVTNEDRLRQICHTI